MIHVIIAEGLIDTYFVAENVRGVDAITTALAPFTPERVAAEAGVDAADIVAAARLYGQAGRAYTMAGTGANMAGPGTLIEYLVLTLNTLRGHWMRAGDVIEALPVLIPMREYRAQATSPVDGHWALGEAFVRGLHQTAAGNPASAMIDHMLLDDDRRFRAVISYGGNPVLAMPDYEKADRAFRSLDLLVQIDPWMSATSMLADYILPPLLPFETASSTVQLDQLSGRATGFGMALPYSNCSDALVPPPVGTDMLEEWQMFTELGRRMGLTLTPRRFDGTAFEVAPDMSSEQLRATMYQGGRIPITDVLAHEGGALYPDKEVRVQPKEAGWEGWLEVGARPMLDELAERAEALTRPAGCADYPFRLISRRMRHVHNSFCNLASTNRGKAYNPAFVHPDDLVHAGLAEGDRVVLCSARGRLEAIVEADPSLRRGLVSMAHCFGGKAGDYARDGGNVNALVPNDDVFDRFTGQPRMSNVPVRIEPLLPVS
jgi:anaerobic selenocysteine-containing dehydrogenase